MDPKDAKNALEFSDRWFELGLLTESQLVALGRKVCAGDDKNTEHYRYGVFMQYLESHQPLLPHLADAIYELGAEDPDPSMGIAMMCDIIALPECPQTVLQKALNSGHKELIKQAVHRNLLTELEAGVTADLVERCLTSRDPSIQRSLLGRRDLGRNHLERLREEGATRAIRNTAADRLRRRHNVNLRWSEWLAR